VSKRKSRRAKLLVGWLEPLTLAFPEFRPILQRSIKELKQEARRNQESDRHLVLAAINAGSWTVDDILDELPTMKRKPLQQILDYFVGQKAVFTDIRKSKESLGGRPQTLYLPHPTAPLK
jgi:hypothetical protein